MTVSEDLRRLLRAKRAYLGLSQHGVAKTLGISLWRYNRIETGVSPPKSAELAALAELLKLPELAHADGERV